MDSQIYVYRAHKIELLRLGNGSRSQLIETLLIEEGWAGRDQLNKKVYAN